MRIKKIIISLRNLLVVISRFSLYFFLLFSASTFAQAPARDLLIIQHEVENCATSHEVKVVPNPASDEITVIGTDDYFLIRIYDLTGRQRFIGMLRRGEPESFKMTFLSPGVYYFHIFTAQDVFYGGLLCILR